MRIAIAMLICLACAASAWATLDPGSDQIGIYFDLAADQICQEGPATGWVQVYMIVTRPTAEVVQGIEFTLCAEPVDAGATALIPVSVSFYAPYVDTADYWDWCDDGRMIWFMEPLPFVGENVPVARFEYLQLTAAAHEFYLGPYSYETQPDGLPAYFDGDMAIHPLGVSSGDPALPVAVLNGDCNIVASDDATLDEVKSLFR